MKKLLKALTLSLGVVMCTTTLVACNGSKVNIIPDPNPYSFDNSDHRPHAEYDANMKIDGKFDEEKWKSVRWLQAEDRPSDAINAKIEISAFVGEKGVFLGGKVEETGTNIWVNPDRGSWTNSCFELYVGPVGQENNRSKTFEFDMQADGTTGNMRLMDPERDMNTTWDIMPVIAAQQIGGKVNTPECTGYTVECFIPWAYLELGGWDISDPDSLQIGIDPVHIFSLRYEGEEVSQNVTSTRIWSRWSEKLLPDIKWLEPDSFFRFNANDGLMVYDYKVNYTGDGKGTVAMKNGNDYLYGWGTSTFTVKPRNGAIVKSIKVNNVDYTDKLRDMSGSYELDVKDPSADLTIDVEFGF